MLYGESDWEKNTTSAASRSIGLLKSAASVTLVSTLRTSKQKVGWDGKPRPKELRRKVDPDNWPDLLEPLSGTYTGEAFTWA